MIGVVDMRLDFIRDVDRVPGMYVFILHRADRDVAASDWVHSFRDEVAQRLGGSPVWTPTPDRGVVQSSDVEAIDLLKRRRPVPPELSQHLPNVARLLGRLDEYVSVRVRFFRSAESAEMKAQREPTDVETATTSEPTDVETANGGRGNPT